MPIPHILVAIWVAVSPHGKHLYAAGINEDAVAVLTVTITSATPMPSVSRWGLVGLAVLMATIVAWHFRKQGAPIH